MAQEPNMGLALLLHHLNLPHYLTLGELLLEQWDAASLEIVLIPLDVFDHCLHLEVNRAFESFSYFIAELEMDVFDSCTAHSIGMQGLH